MAEIIVRPRAESDILSQVEYYEAKHVGLGGNFSICIDDAMSSISQYPFLSTIVYKDIRRKLVRRFPYAIFYVLRDDNIIVLRVLGQVRDPAILKKIRRI